MCSSAGTCLSFVQPYSDSLSLFTHFSEKLITTEPLLPVCRSRDSTALFLVKVFDRLIANAAPDQVILKRLRTGFGWKVGAGGWNRAFVVEFFYCFAVCGPVY